MLNLLLIQLRDHGDPMALHELECVRRRVGERRAHLIPRNAFTESADRGWLEGIDGMVIGGSGDFSVHHPLSEPWVTPLRHLIESVLERNVPTFGICFGHQLIAYHLGCEILTSGDHTEIGTASFRLTEEGQRCEVFSHLGTEFDAHTGHSDHVVDEHHRLIRLAENDVIDNQAFRVSGARTWSTQFHPDLTGAEARSRYLAYHRNFKGQIDSERLKKAERFEPGRDEAAQLIGRFVDQLEQTW